MTSRGRPPTSIMVRAPISREHKVTNRDRIVDALVRILVADMEREAFEQARLSSSSGRVSSDQIEEAKAS